VLEIRQCFVDLIVAVAFGDQIFEFDSAARRHLKNLFDIVGLAARYPRDGNFPSDEIAAADREWPAP